jgi:hypothetical protein
MTDSHIDTNPVEAAGQGYDRGSVWVNDTIEVFPTTADAATDAEAAASAKALSCQFGVAGPANDQGLGPQLGPSEHDKLPPLGVLTFDGHDSNEMWSMIYTYRGKAYTYYNDWVTVQSGTLRVKVLDLQPAFTRADQLRQSVGKGSRRTYERPLTSVEVHPPPFIGKIQFAGHFGWMRIDPTVDVDDAGEGNRPSGAVVRLPSWFGSNLKCIWG